MTSSLVRPGSAAVVAAAPMLAVVEVTRRRPQAPRYHAYVQTLNERLVEAAAELGWDARRFAAGDLGAAELLRATDGAAAVVVAGGEDLDPATWGGRRGYEGEGRHDEEADAGQVALVRRALARSTPLLGICRGHQVIDVALGGTLVPHLDDAHGVHRGSGPVESLMVDHDVVLEPGSRVAAALGATTARVRSAHHQAVDRLGEGLRVVARTADGEVEAVEHETAPITGVQWHPEDRGADRGQLPLLLSLLAEQAGAAARAA
ncbi:gamma-glutamyl-gamma-aminobutyrate hydrolase family protein [Frigoribacterium faeni]|uniref:gamma-glutamyl-gamma-aminobutyrate hydrolase family protein n=1 Tax=Frigoribacterium faeni TaxID=145483 RepID=UPI00141B41B4|nr:gamma-glutamyl-gamma-aminobutyrate hydrolase family protein [Frigoribacterium faeni]NIJ03934.1 putative glutamine amidotransferase [Frigoribacterium faeni]